MFTYSSSEPECRYYIFDNPDDAKAFAKLFKGCNYFGRYVFI